MELTARQKPVRVAPVATSRDRHHRGQPRRVLALLQRRMAVRPGAAEVGDRASHRGDRIGSDCDAAMCRQVSQVGVERVSEAASIRELDADGIAPLGDGDPQERADPIDGPDGRRIGSVRAVGGAWSGPARRAGCQGAADGRERVAVRRSSGRQGPAGHVTPAGTCRRRNRYAVGSGRSGRNRCTRHVQSMSRGSDSHDEECGTAPQTRIGDGARGLRPRCAICPPGDQPV